MNTYKILWSRQDYGNIIVKANSEQEAKEKFEQGNYKDVDLNIKGGEMTSEGVELLADYSF